MTRLSTYALAMLACLAFGALSSVDAGRELAQAPRPTTTAVAPTEGCSASPGSNRPQECQNGFLGIGGQQWDKDELECALPNSYQLKCDHNQETFGSNTVRCNIDAGVLSTEIKFECPVNSNCVVNCPPSEIAKLPGVVAEPVRRILTAWRPREDIIG